MNARALFPLLLALTLSACGGGNEMNADDAALLEGDAPADTAAPAQAAAAEAKPAAEAAQPAPAEEVAQVTLASDGVALGSRLNGEGAAEGARQSYSLADTVYASVPVAGFAAKEVTIYWFGSNGRSLKQETKPIPVGAKFVNFSLSKADGLAAGNYTAQVDMDGAPQGMMDFSVKP